MRVLVAMSGGVDSSVAAGVLASAGHDVVGATLKLWGGASDSGCCSVSDVEDARRVARQLGIVHHVFNMTDQFEASVVDHYVAAHAKGETPNPCIECNRHIKFGALAERARRLGFDALATGHHARVVAGGPGGPELRRGADPAKDQSYVLSMLDGRQLASLVLPVGVMSKAEVRQWASARRLTTAAKPDSQDVCFIHSETGRRGFLAERMAVHPGTVVDADSGEAIGAVPAVELVTVGQRRGLGTGVGGRRHFAVSVDVASRRVAVSGLERAVSDEVALERWCWVGTEMGPGQRVVAQTSAHGRPVPAEVVPGGIRFDQPHRLVAPGQTVAFYSHDDPDMVVGSAIAAAR